MRPFAWLVYLALALCNSSGTPNQWQSITPGRQTHPPGRAFSAVSHTSIDPPGAGEFDRILLFGGWNGFTTLYSDTWSYHVQSGEWHLYGTPTVDVEQYPSARYGHSLTALLNPKLGLMFSVLYGGDTRAGVSNETFIYSILFESGEGGEFGWRRDNTSHSPGPRFMHAATRISPTVLVLFGGQIDSSFARVSNETWLFNALQVDGDHSVPVGWSRLEFNVSATPLARSYHAMTSNNDSTVAFLYGGRTTDLQILDDLYSFAYNTTEGAFRWTLLCCNCTNSNGRMASSMAAISDYELFIFGGVGRGNDQTHTIIFNTNTLQWRLVMPIDHTLPPPRAGAAMLYMDIINGVIVLNGATVSGNFLDDMYLYSLSLDDWENLTGDQVFPAGRIAGSVSGSGDTLTIYGGASVFLTEERLLGSLWTLDTTNHQWTEQSYWQQCQRGSEFGCPPVRAEHVGTYLPFAQFPFANLNFDIFVIFAGVTHGETFLNDTWVCRISEQIVVEFYPLTIFYEQQAQETNGSYAREVPPSRAGASSTTLGHALYIFGGESDKHSMMLDDLWMFGPIACPGCDADRLYGDTSLAWSKVPVAPTSIIPPARCGASMSAYGNALYLSGGSSRCLVALFNNQQISIAFYETMWTFSLRTNEWKPVAMTRPLLSLYLSHAPPLSFSAVARAGRHMIISGGLGNDGASSDTFIFDMLEHSIRVWDTQGLINPTFGHGAFWHESSGELFVFGGAQQEIIASNQLRSISLTCLPGTESTSPLSVTSFGTSSCAPCSPGYYNGDSNSTCVACPSRSSTREPGATSETFCLVCEPNTCHGHGQCTITGDFIARCTCEAGYVSSDYCHWPWVGIGVAMGLLVVLVAAIIIFRLHKKGKRFESSTFLFERLLDEKEQQMAVLESVFAIERKELTKERPIASGGFGEVWLCRWGTMNVAVKFLHSELMEADVTALEEFQVELKTTRVQRHPHVVHFYGGGVEEDTRRPFIVMEFLARGSLHSLLYDPALSLPWSRRVGFAVDIAEGMVYLHERVPPLIHRDLKALNLLVAENWSVKVGDFGASRILQSHVQARGTTTNAHRGRQHGSPSSSGSQGISLSDQKAMTARAGSPLWQAPEVLNASRYDCSTDVYAFGMVLYEILERQLPYYHLEELWDIERAILVGKRPILSDHQDLVTVPSQLSVYLALMEACWSQQSEARPTMEKALLCLQRLVSGRAHTVVRSANASVV